MKKRITLKRLCALMASALLLFCVLPSQAQNVTVKPSTGSMIAAVPEQIEGTTGDYDTFYRRGGFATWRHNQLCLTMTTSDASDLTDNGQLANPANNLYGRTSTNEIEMGRGALESTRNCYMNLALPKGYRFTGYEIVFSRNRDDFGSGNYSPNSNTAGTMRFGETNDQFEYLNGYYKDIEYDEDATIDEGSVTIKKEDETGMSNVLYFRLTDAETGTGRMVVTFHSITLYFTAEDDYTPVISQTTIETPVSAVDIPFATGKVDYGSIERRTYNGISRVSYSSANVIDMEAYMTLYEAESVTGGTNFDGTTGDVVEYKDGTIYNYQDFFRLGKEGEEQVYFIETPTYVTLPDANHTKNPVGYRIIGAELEYQFGTAMPANEVRKPHTYITYQSGNTTYYLDDDGNFVTNKKTEWFTDDDGRIYSEGGYLGFTVSGNGRNYTLTTKNPTIPNYPLYVYNGNVRGTYRDGWFDTYHPYLIGSTSTATLSTSNSNKRASWATETTVTTIPAYTPASFKFHIYGKDGTLLETREVNSSDDNGTVTLTGLNNDAVKFGVEGIGFVKGTLTMQALDPYIDRMSVVCQDQDNPDIRMTQTFEANDFSVSGGEFYFYLPSGCVDHNVKVTYEDLWSHYADDSYEGGSSEHNSRFNFVNSEHYNKFTSDNIYNDVSEAAAGKDDVSERLKVETVGRTKFKFNNADQLSGTAGTLTEYPFTQANYRAAPNNGSFYIMEYTVSDTDKKKTAYVFTTDETRYNIAPTTAIQHRTYAFYEMIVHVQSATYDPKVKIKKIYDATYTNNNGTEETKPYYAAIVTAPFGKPEQAGFASDLEIEEAIDDVITLRKDNFDNTDVPESAKQILYVDLSGLAGYYVNAQAPMTMNEYKNQKLATNALIFMPKGVTTFDDNFAFMTEGNNFRAANNIVLTDKQPFFSPYDIQVPSQHCATYTRLISADMNGQVQNASLILPFKLAVNGEGVHSNSDGSSFQLHNLAKINVDQIEDVNNFDGDGVFTPIQTTDGQAAANTPYMVRVLDGTEPGSNYSFKVSQYGADIVATPQSTKIEGETVSGIKVGDNTGSLTNWGTYSGETINKNLNIFYFAKNKYVSSLNLSAKYPSVYVQPFRAYYTSEGLSSAGAKMMTSFNVVYDFVEEDDTATGINATAFTGPFTLAPGNGTLTVRANENVNVRIVSLNGNGIAYMNMQAGDVEAVNLPAGVYLVNNQKVVIR